MVSQSDNRKLYKHKALCKLCKHKSLDNSKLGKWPSGLRRCSKNRKVPSSNLTWSLAGLRDPTSLWGSWWPSGRKCKKRSDWHRVSEAVPSIMAQSWPWGGQIAVKKKRSYMYFYQRVQNMVLQYFEKKFIDRVATESFLKYSAIWIVFCLFFSQQLCTYW